MIETLQIENFKSIKHLDLSCKKVNVFIGEPNAGKSNIIEALSLFSMKNHNLRNFVRFQNLTDLYFDNQTQKDVVINIGIESCIIRYDNERFLFEFNSGGRGAFDISGNISQQGVLSISPVKYYKYKSEGGTNGGQPGALIAPFGENLVSVILSNSEFKNLVTEIFKSKGFRLNIKPVEREMLISKEKNDEIYSYSYNNISETLKRIIFFMASLETNQNTALIFDEPEANTFPFYTKYFAERIAFNETNQFFFTTHNPYLLESIVAKTSFADLNVSIAYMENYETKLRILNKEEVIELMDLDIFFNLKRYTEAG